MQDIAKFNEKLLMILNDIGGIYLGYLNTWVQQNPLTKKAYKVVKRISQMNRFSINSLKTIECIACETENTLFRLNLLLPTINKYKIFGGVATALKFFEDLSMELDVDMRIIITRDERYNSNYTQDLDGYTYNKNKGHKQAAFLADNNKIEVRKNDIFLCTSWDTAYIIQDVFKWQRANYGIKQIKMVYMIQDYEPGFYPWSTEYMLAESTYKNNENVDVIGVFNSKQLYDFFGLRGYSFWKKFYFNPNLNSTLAEYLKLNVDNYKRQKRILLYGRPGSARNAFEIIVHALRLWSNRYPESSEWEIISLGENFEDVNVGNGVIIHCLGKASLEEYGKMMLETYIGISLMVSAHPSYPPLEMSTFGIKTITNTFENKQLRDFNDNIISLDKCTPEEISNYLIDLCKLYPAQIGQIYSETDYVNDNNSIKGVVTNVAGVLK